MDHITAPTLSKYRWNFLNHIDEQELSNFSGSINVPISIGRILMNRGIKNFDDAKFFFRPSAEKMHDPFLMKDMEIAVERLIRAHEAKEGIMIYGDYDVDGTSGTALLYAFFRDIGANIHYYINDRIKEGYGVAKSGINWAHENGVKIIISVDCGITAVDQAEYCRSLGIDFIICDHHTVGDKVPKAYAILNPKRPDCEYPFKELCGCGVGFKLTQAISQRMNIHPNVAEKYLDFVAVAVAADIVPLIDENRVLTRMGLEIIQAQPRPGWIAMEKKTGLQLNKVNSSQIVFSIGPRINAVGRLGDAKRAVQLMISQTIEEAMGFAEVLEEENTNRRVIDEDTFQDAIHLAETYLKEHSGLSIVLHNEKWHPGVIGIVASRLVEKFYRPAIILSTIDGVAKGSARSINGFDVYEAIKAVDDCVIQFGGHKYAAGLSVKLDRLTELQDRFDEVVTRTLLPDLLTQEILIDTELKLEEINQRFWVLLKQFQPHGPNNMRPVFYSRNVEVVGYPSIVGKGHLKFKVKQNGSTTYEVIGYNMEHLYNHVQPGNRGLEIIYCIEENQWNGKSQIQLQLKDAKLG